MKEEQKGKKELQDFGLSADEATVYLTLVNTSAETVLELSRCCDVKRSTIYLVLDKLVSRGLVNVVVKGSKKYYYAADPQKFLDILDESRSELEPVIPMLRNNLDQKQDKPQVKFLEGRDGIEQVYKEVQASRTESLWYGSAGDMKSEFVRAFNKMLDLQESDENFPGMRDLVNNTKKDIKYAKERNAKRNAKIKVKVMDKDLFFLNADNIIYDNKLAILSIGHYYFATIIESRTVADAYRCMYEMAWRQANYP